MYLGDILEAAMESYIENSNLPNGSPGPLRDLRVITGPVQYLTNYYDSSTGQGFALSLNSKTGKLEQANKTYKAADTVIVQGEGGGVKALPLGLLNLAREFAKYIHSDIAKIVDEYEPKARSQFPDLTSGFYREALIEAGREELSRSLPQATSDIEPVICNIADLPISLNNFNDWVSKNLLETGKDRLSFDEFAKLVISDFASQTIKYDSESLILPRVDSQIIRGVHSAYTKDRSEAYADKLGFIAASYENANYSVNTGAREAPMWLPSFRKEGKLVTIEQLIANNAVPLPSSETGDSTKRRHMADYLLIYGEQVSYEKDFNKTEDMLNGIYHLEVGRDAGVVRDIKFSVADDTAFESFVIQRALKNKENIRKRIYDATVELEGITFFRPGQKVFLNPSAYGSARNLKAFGLLGYYTIITVENSLENGQYRTNLTCKFHSWPKL
jgi:hypothetical protein